MGGKGVGVWQGVFRKIRNQGVGGTPSPPKPPPPPPQTKVTIVEKNEIYRWKNVVEAFLVLKLWVPDPSPHSNIPPPAHIAPPPPPGPGTPASSPLPPPLCKLRPCPSYSRRRDHVDLGPNFNSVPNIVQPHKTWVS